VFTARYGMNRILYITQVNVRVVKCSKPTPSTHYGYANMAVRRCVYSQCEGIARTHHSSYTSWGSITPYTKLSQPADSGLPAHKMLVVRFDGELREKQASRLCCHLLALRTSEGRKGYSITGREGGGSKG
jgi:hypothetical protein